MVEVTGVVSREISRLKRRETAGLAGIRVLVTPRKRLKRDDNSSPSILLTMTQSKVSTTSNDVTQVVCIKTKSKLLQTLEIDHNLFTGFTANFDKFEIINGTAKMIGIQQQMETGLHFALTGLTPELPSCYMLIIYEPKIPYTASFLAPVTVDAYYNQVRAQIVIHATDIRILLPGPSVNMSRRSMASIFRRPKRASDDTTAAQLVDTVCLEHGTMQHYLLRDGDTLDGGDITADDGDAPCAQHQL